MTTFAYKHITEAIESRAYKFDVYVKKINPAYTSMIAKIKYMRRMRLPIHTVAAMVIGRRGMGFKEEIPQIYKDAIDFSDCKTEWDMYRLIYQKIKDVPINCFYQKIDNLKEFVKNNKIKH